MEGTFSALIPSKDTIFFLSKIQREILAENSALPNFPLWAFGADIPEAKAPAEILFPRQEGSGLFFPVRAGGREFKIKLGTLREGRKATFSSVPESSFPRRERVFKTAMVELKDGGWSAGEEKWLKAKAST